MPWARFDDGFDEHPKIEGMLDRELELDALAAIGLFALTVTNSARRLTDGAVSERTLAQLAPKHGARLAKILRAHGLYDGPAGHRIIHDFLDKNPTAEQVKAQRKSNAARQARHRERRNAVTDTIEESLAAVTGPRVTSAITPEFFEGKVNELNRACGSTPEGLTKIRRTIRAHKSAIGDVIAATEAAQGPGVRDPLGVALSTLTKRTHAKAKAA